MRNRLSDRTEEIFYEHALSIEDGDALIGHLPCHVYHKDSGLIFYLDTFKETNDQGYKYAGAIEGIRSSSITLDVTDTLLILDGDPFAW